MKVSTTGYKRNSKDKKHKQLYIPGDVLTMLGVDDYVSATPQYPDGSLGQTTTMTPGTPRISFPGAVGVIEEKLPEFALGGPGDPDKPIYTATKSNPEFQIINGKYVFTLPDGSTWAESKLERAQSISNYLKNGWGFTGERLANGEPAWSRIRTTEQPQNVVEPKAAVIPDTTKQYQPGIQRVQVNTDKGDVIKLQDIKTKKFMGYEVSGKPLNMSNATGDPSVDFRQNLKMFASLKPEDETLAGRDTNYREAYYSFANTLGNQSPTPLLPPYYAMYNDGVPYMNPDFRSALLQNRYNMPSEEGVRLKSQGYTFFPESGTWGIDINKQGPGEVGYKQSGGELPQAQIGFMDDLFKRRALKKYPAMQNVYGPKGENLNIIRDKNFDASSHGFGDIEFLFPGSGTVNYSDDYTYQSPTPDKYTAVYNPKGAGRGDVFLDMLHGMRNDPRYTELLQNFGNTVKDARGDDMRYFYEKELLAGRAIDGMDHWNDNYIDGMLRAELYPYTPGRPSARKDYEIERQESSPEMQKAAMDIYNYLRTGPKKLSEQQQGGQLPKAQKGIDWEALSNPELGRRAKAAGWDNVEQYRNAKWAYNTTAQGTPKADLPKFPTRTGPTVEAAELDKFQKEQLQKIGQYKKFSPGDDPAGLPSVPIFESLLMAPVALSSASALINAPLLGSGLSAANIANPIFFGQGIKNTLDPESDMRKSWSKAYNNPSKSNLIDATLETGLNSLNFLGAGSVGSDLNKMGNFVGRQVNAVRNDIDIIRNAGKYARDMQWQTADDVFNLQGSKQLGSKQLALPGSPNTFKSEIDWSKWNKQIPNNLELINEYNTIEQTSKANGTWMKNPDGSEFTGTPEQFVQQNSQNFKNAFGNSQLLNPDGSPMFLYHGSAKKFDVFDPSMFQLGDAGYSGAGIYTTPSKTTANSYALSSAKFHKGDIEPTVYELYGQGNKPIKASDLIKENANRDLFNFHRDANFKGPLSDYESLRNYDVAIADQLPGVENIRPINDAREIVFPTNTQVKSAIGNNGMFDLSNPNIYEHQIRGLVGPNTSTGLTEENVADVINRQKEWLKSEEYVKRRSANTGETPQEVRQAVDKTLRAAENARFNLNSNITAQGKMTPQTFLQRFPKVEIAKHTYNPMNTLEHEVSHLYSPVIFNMSDAALHKGLFDPNVANLSASERGLYANYPRLGTDYDKTAASIDFDAPENYLKTGPEQQVRHLGVRNDILKANNLPIDAQLTEAEIKPFIDSWAQRINKRSKDPENLDNIKAEMDYDEIWLEEAYKIRENLLKEYGVKSDLDLTPAQAKEYVQRTKDQLAKNVTDVLNKAWIAVPAAIGVGAATQQKKKGGSVNKRNHKDLDNYFTQAWSKSRKTA